MFLAKIKNIYGEILELTHNPNYNIISISGLSPVSAAINTSVLATADGTMFNRSRKGERNIVITISINTPVEKNRLQLYRYAPTKFPIQFSFKNDSREVFIDGYVESHEVNLFENGQLAQISIICPQPFFKSVKECIFELSAITSLFKFPFWINQGQPIAFSSVSMEAQITVWNEGDTETGMIIELHAERTVINPIIYNRDTGEKFEVIYSMVKGDVIKINTNAGEKSVLLIRNGDEYNIINYVNLNNDWFVIRNGANVFTYECADGYEFLKILFLVTNKFEGV